MAEWLDQNIPVNVSGVVARVPGSSWRVPRGPVRFKIVKAGLEKTNDGSGLRADFDIVFTSPSECAGAERTVITRIPVASDKSEKAMNSRGIFRGWLEAVGQDAAGLDAGTINVKGRDFVGKEVGGWHEPKYETIARRDGNGTIEVDNGDTTAVSAATWEKIKDKKPDQPEVRANTRTAGTGTQTASTSGTASVDLPETTQPVTQPTNTGTPAGLDDMLKGLGLG